MNSMLCIPRNLYKVVEELNLYPKVYYELPSNFDNLTFKERMKELCKRTSSLMEEKLPRHILGEYIQKLISDYKVAVYENNDENNNLLSLKLLFIYNYLNKKITKFTNLSFEDDENEYFDKLFCNLDEYTFTGMDLYSNNLNKNYNLIKQNYANYCIIKDYIDKYYTSLSDNNKMNFVNYSSLDYIHLVNFLKVLTPGITNYKLLVEDIIQNSFSNEVRMLYNDRYNKKNLQLNNLLIQLKEYNNNPHKYLSKYKKQQKRIEDKLINNLKDYDTSDSEVEKGNESESDNTDIDDNIELE